MSRQVVRSGWQERRKEGLRFRRSQFGLFGGDAHFTSPRRFSFQLRKGLRTPAGTGTEDVLAAIFIVVLSPFSTGSILSE